MGFHLSKRASLRKGRWLRSGDGLRVTLVTAALFGALLAVFVLATVSRTSLIVPSGTQTQATALPAPDERDHRFGSIVFVSRKKMCEELRFDNISEQVLSFGYVDCEARLVRDTDADALARAKQARAASVLSSFKK